MQIELSEFLAEITAQKRTLQYLYDICDKQGNVEISCNQVVSEVKYLEGSHKIVIIGKDEDTTWLMQAIACDTIHTIQKTTEHATTTYHLSVNPNTSISLRVEFY